MLGGTACLLEAGLSVGGLSMGGLAARSLFADTSLTAGPLWELVWLFGSKDSVIAIMALLSTEKYYAGIHNTK